MDADDVELSRKFFAKHKLNFFPSHNFNYENFPFTWIPKDLYR